MASLKLQGPGPWCHLIQSQIQAGSFLTKPSIPSLNSPDYEKHSPMELGLLLGTSELCPWDFLEYSKDASTHQPDRYLKGTFVSPYPFLLLKLYPSSTNTQLLKPPKRRHIPGFQSLPPLPVFPASNRLWDPEQADQAECSAPSPPLSRDWALLAER